MVPPEPSPLLHLPLGQPWGPGTRGCFIVKFTHHFLSTHSEELGQSLCLFPGLTAEGL